ncbi:DNA polymerase III subunit delta' [Parvibaculum sp.]|uniref:DNA polymerase III subunit delta' n=1 Tax=Parvibaculum sp. TaxID=2024848 RepID=UPI000C8B5B10|nr:DNA polymerase III subunit delta' [Parvibaculum sp.]MAB15358.1 DNA polymerase III subunit delta' [Parvibaculum sp.]
MSDTPESDRLGDFPHPRETAGLIGQDEAEQVLFDAFMSGRMHHAWLLTGPKGIGKATLAHRMAKFVLRYGSPEAARAAGATGLYLREDDPVFRQGLAQSLSDLLVIRRPYDDKSKRLKTIIPVEEVRRTAGFFGMSAGAGGWRVTIIDSADEMNANAANALLKVLEEPPANSLFLVISHQPGRLLPTIRSRCRTLPLKPLSHDAIAEVLAANEAEAAPDDREAIARLAEGSAGRALSLSAGGGLDLYKRVTNILMGLPKLDVEAVHELGDKVGRRGAEDAYFATVELLTDWLQRLIRAGSGLDTGADIVVGEGAAMARLAKGSRLDRWVEVWEKISQTVARAEALNTDRKLVILTIFSMLENAAAELAKA